MWELMPSGVTDALQGVQKCSAALVPEREWAGRTINEHAPMSFPMSGSS